MCSELPQVPDIHVELADMTHNLQHKKAALGIGSWGPDRSIEMEYSLIQEISTPEGW